MELEKGTDQLSAVRPGGPEVILTRVFDASRRKVFDAWTDPTHFANWFGPEGATMPYCAMDVRPGGSLHFCHHGPDGTDVWAKCIFREVDEPTRLLLDVYFSDPEGNLTPRPGFVQGSRVAVSFAEEGDRTRITIRHSGLEKDQGESQGWKESLDRLGRYLAEFQL